MCKQVLQPSCVGVLATCILPSCCHDLPGRWPKSNQKNGALVQVAQLSGSLDGTRCHPCEGTAFGWPNWGKMRKKWLQNQLVGPKLDSNFTQLGITRILNRTGLNTDINVGACSPKIWTLIYLSQSIAGAPMMSLAQFGQMSVLLSGGCPSSGHEPSTRTEG